MMVGSAWQCQSALRSAGLYRLNLRIKVHFVQPSQTLSFKYWYIAIQGAVFSQHCLGQICIEDQTVA